MVLLTADTDYKPNYNPDFNDPKAYVGVDPKATTAQWMKAAAKQNFKKLLKTHYKDYAALYNRVNFNLEGPSSAKPTNVRLADYRKGGKDNGLETLYYQFCAATCSSLHRVRATCRLTCRAFGTTMSTARGVWTITTTSTCK